MRSVLILVILAIAGITAFLVLGRSTQTIGLSNAQAVPVTGQADMVMGALSIQNSGGADRLLGASSPDAERVTIMNPSGDAALVVPAGGAALLAADGAHLMIYGLTDDLKTGASLPVTLTFARAGDVATRMQLAAMANMNHTGAMQMPADTGTPAPTIAIVPPDTISAKGFSVDLVTDHFAFVKTPDGAPHVAGEGHAHLYLNGLKLGRLYGPKVTIGGLLPGDYTLRVALNTHDHRPYMRDGAPTQATLEFQIEP